MTTKKITTRRIDELDLLRGFFIVIIILDHLQFWPSPLQYLTGQGKLWVSAAEGFFLISGLLIGYLRIYKEWHTPLRQLAKKLAQRALLLYIWCVGITFAVVALSMLLPGDGALLPKLANTEQMSSLPTYIWSVISTHYSSDWIYFLRLYTIMLLLTPPFIWLIRKGWWSIAAGLSLGIYTASLVFGIDEGAMQWQILFFGAALIGWKLEAILSWLHTHPRVRTIGMSSVITLTLVTMIASYFFVHGWGIVESPSTTITRDTYISIRANVDPLFSNNPMVPLRIGLAFVWFIGLLGLFHIGKKYIKRAFGWLLMPFGTQSLSLYCLQALLMPFFVTLIPMGEFYYNGLIGVLVVVVLWGIMKIPLVQKILPR
ncbi:MAG: OpgC domain-containing protein [Candidatus Saccharimonadales bacterium]